MSRLVRRFVLAGAAALGLGWLLERRIAAQSDLLAGQALIESIHSEVVIRAPIERTWDELADIPGQVRWMTEMKWVQVLTPGPVGVGTRAVALVRALGIPVRDSILITEWRPPSRYAIRHTGLVKGTGEIELESGDSPGTTHLTWDETLIAPLFPHLGGIVFRAVFGPIFQADLEAFARIVEAS
jgi:Polyketide cyclase / dehydrase and lipid transport